MFVTERLRPFNDVYGAVEALKSVVQVECHYCCARSYGQLDGERRECEEFKEEVKMQPSQHHNGSMGE